MFFGPRAFVGSNPFARISFLHCSMKVRHWIHFHRESASIKRFHRESRSNGYTFTMKALHWLHFGDPQYKYTDKVIFKNLQQNFVNLYRKKN